MTSSPGFSLAERVALITGGGRGIGRAIALAFAASGAEVAVTSRTLAELEETCQEINKMGRRGLPFAADIGKEADVEGMAAKVMENFGRIDILVNNAGISAARKPAEEVSLEEWDHLLSINLRGTWMVCQAVGRLMIPRRRGKIINVGSVNAAQPSAGVVHYNVSKAALGALTESLALEWAKYNIQVNTLGPGAVRTRMMEKRLAQPEILQTILNRIPAGRIGEPEDMAGAALFLASDASNYVTGETIYVHGGYLLT
jgi:NAD(P)-dependent dehydrogenase (short-subunit alcohol dehydrogenase family)